MGGSRPRRSTIQTFLLVFLIVHKNRVLSASSYYYSRYGATWYIAKQECETIGGFLVKFDDINELTNVTSGRAFWLPKTSYIWCGLKDIDGLNTHHHWRDDTPLTDVSMWSPGQPTGASGGCGYMHPDNLLADDACGREYSFMCEVDEGSQLAKSKADLRSCYVGNDLIRPVRDAETYEVPKCPRNKIYFCPSHWKYFLTWTQAEAYCKLANGNLAKITTREEQIMADRFRKVRGYSHNYWIGGTDSASEGQYTWADGELIGGDGGWPSFVTTTEPAADASKNCVATGGNRAWYMGNCNTRYPILCEMQTDVLPNHQACYWELPSTTWTNQRQLCVSGGGHLAHIRTMTHFERLMKLATSHHVVVGMSDEGQTWEWVLTDGTKMTWSNWLGNTEPNSLREQYGVYWYHTRTFNDAPNLSYFGLCEKRVFQFENADIVHALGSITVTCHKPCVFQNGMRSKTWTCADIDVTSAAEGCTCEDGFWIIMEPWLNHLNASVVQDNDNDTCITIGRTIHVLTLHHTQLFYGNFEAEVILSPDLEHLRSDIIHVFTSTDLSSPEATCRLSGPLSKCRNVSGSKYACQCSNICKVYIKVFQTKKAMLPLTLCDLQVMPV